MFSYTVQVLKTKPLTISFQTTPANQKRSQTFWIYPLHKTSVLRMSKLNYWFYFFRIGLNLDLIRKKKVSLPYACCHYKMIKLLPVWNCVFEICSNPFILVHRLPPIPSPPSAWSSLVYIYFILCYLVYHFNTDQIISILEELNIMVQDLVKKLSLKKSKISFLQFIISMALAIYWMEKSVL